MTCSEVNASMAALLVELQPLTHEARDHVAECDTCAADLAAIEATAKLLGEWQAPEPSAFFDTRLYARLRTEQLTAPAGFLEQTKSWLMYSCNLQMRHVAAGTLAMVLAVCGGLFAIIGQPKPMPGGESSAAVRELQSYDRNADLFEKLNELDRDDGSVSDPAN